MKKNFVVITLLLVFASYAKANSVQDEQAVISSVQTKDVQNEQELITIVLMVKNEQAVMEQTLEPFTKAGIKSFLIFDTGSTDDTISVTHNFFKKHHITNYVIAEEPFIDFATSRNHALEAAEKEFPNTVFFVMPDAEWYMHNVKGLMDFCEQEREKSLPAYMVRVTNATIDFPVSRLIRASAHARFERGVHETIPVREPKKVPQDVYFELGMSRYGIEKSRKRWERDAALLLREHESNPTDPRTTFYLAQTYECLGDIEKAFHYYKLRATQPGWREENYETFYRLGRVTERLSETDPSCTWPMAFEYYSIAHNIMPHRAEPLVRMAYHYWPDGVGPSNAALCYLFAKRACELDYPDKDLLFIDPTMYNFKRYEILSKSAWQVGDFENGETATRNALQAHEMPHLLNNLAAYVTRRTQQPQQ
jgi:hypothetical protein